jgi:hypothetical protein
MMKYLIPFPILLLFLLQSCLNEGTQALIGAKIYEHLGSYDLLFQEWNQMGINTGFCSEELISDPEFMREAREHQVSTFVIFPVYYNPEEIARTPHLAAINRNGEAAAEDWVEFVCPSREDYRQQVLRHARRLIRNHQPDGISIDFIRHFVYWEKVYPDHDPASLPISCFDSVCMDHFSAESGITLPEELSKIPEKADWILKNHENSWTTWRCSLITSMLKDIAEAAREEKPDILINVHLVPWAEEDFNGALRKVAGQDIRALSALSNYISPMTYAHMLKQPPDWVHGIVQDFHRQTGARVLPSIQVGKAYLETDYDLEEFRDMMEAALEAPSSGVVIWSWERLMAEPEKAKLFKDIVTAR